MTIALDTAPIRPPRRDRAGRVARAAGIAADASTPLGLGFLAPLVSAVAGDDPAGN